METQIKLRSFESKITFMNGMYKLPVAPIPSTELAVKWQKEQNPLVPLVGNNAAIVNRMVAFKKILQDELNEMDDIIKQLKDNSYESEVDFLVDITDLMHDITIYCQSELVRFGIPLKETMSIIMDSNFSKLGADGQPIIKDGKFEKGPHYWKPEPALHDFITEAIKEGSKE